MKKKSSIITKSIILGGVRSRRFRLGRWRWRGQGWAVSSNCQASSQNKKNERKCAILNPEPSIKSRIIIFFILVDALYEFERDSSLVLNVLYKFSSTGAKLNCKNDKYRNPSSNYCPLLFIIRSWAASSIAKNNWTHTSMIILKLNLFAL